ncbi:uncharacterized protein LOC116544096 [Sapajus apella]|uniref:Uncharacterized protein LOC116544096 n=1 Tax=Sapajus apella TaxID=9515 RepID=A0A6J3H8F2_SAPAP|nr:uncharacterized protein LOC116544096 [Sapajus apella]
MEAKGVVKSSEGNWDGLASWFQAAGPEATGLSQGWGQGVLGCSVSRLVATQPHVSSPGLSPHSLGLQPGLHERGDDPGPPSAPGGGAADADVWPPTHDPVYLPAQPGPCGPPQGALLRLLRTRHSHTATCPAPHAPSTLTLSLPHIAHWGSGFSLACPCPGASSGSAGLLGPLWEQGSVPGGPRLSLQGGSCRHLLVLTRDAPPHPCPRDPSSTPHTHYKAEGCQQPPRPTLPGLGPQSGCQQMRMGSPQLQVPGPPPSLTCRHHSRLRAGPRPQHLTLHETATPESPLGGAAPHPGLWPTRSLAHLWLEWEEGAGHGPSAFPSNPSKHRGSLGSPELWAGQPTAPPGCFGVLGWGHHPRQQDSHNHLCLFLCPTPSPPALTPSTGGF